MAAKQLANSVMDTLMCAFKQFAGYPRLVRLLFLAAFTTVLGFGMWLQYRSIRHIIHKPMVSDIPFIFQEIRRFDSVNYPDSSSDQELYRDLAGAIARLAPDPDIYSHDFIQYAVHGLSDNSAGVVSSVLLGMRRRLEMRHRYSAATVPPQYDTVIDALLPVLLTRWQRSGRPGGFPRHWPNTIGTTSPRDAARGCIEAILANTGTHYHKQLAPFFLRRDFKTLGGVCSYRE
jgi:hypothetical protein